MADFKADFVIANVNPKGILPLNEKMAREIRRRKIKLLIDVDDATNLEKNASILSLANGLVTSRSANELDSILTYMRRE